MVEFSGIELPEIVKMLPEVLKAAFSEKNRERFASVHEKVDEMSDDLVECVEIVLDMLREPLAIAGIELPKTRQLTKTELELLIEKAIVKVLEKR